MSGGVGIDCSTLATAHRYSSKEHAWESIPAMSKRSYSLKLQIKIYNDSLARLKLLYKIIFFT